MSKLSELDHALCERDHNRLEIYHPAIFSALEKAVKEGATDKQIGGLLRSRVNDTEIMQVVLNALRYMRHAESPQT